MFSQTASLRGQVSDESAAIIPGAKVTLVGPTGKAQSKTAATDATYSFSGLVPGDYTISASAPEMALTPIKAVIKAGTQILDLKLQVVAASQRVSVNDQQNGIAVGTDPTANAGALVLRGSDLDILADNPEDLAADLAALAGPSAGPNGGSIFIDGFSGGQIPSKDSIREIRINQNPFSPEYDKLGFGRIEIFTKPGSDKFRGTLFYNVGHDALNSRNPYAAKKAPFFLQEYGGNISGPLGKKASFFLDIQEHAIDNGSIINGVTLNPTSLQILDPFTDVLSIPQRRFLANPRVDYQINQKHTIAARYVYSPSDVADSGVGNLNLVSRGVHAKDHNHTLQLTETAVLGSSVINETRFQILHLDASRTANLQEPAIQVLGAFNGGGSPVGRQTTAQTNLELQNYTSVASGRHTIRFGVRMRTERFDTVSPANFVGTFTFAGNGTVSSIEAYRRTLQYEKAGIGWPQIRALGGGASQFTFNAGQPQLAASQFDAGLFIGDDFRWKPNLTVSYGLRYEDQTNLSNHTNFAPRIGIAWALGGKGKSGPKTVIRSGFGMFYDRFSLDNTLTALRYGGQIQKQIVIRDPLFFNAIPPLSSLSGQQSLQTIQQVSSSLRSPYLIQSALGMERQLPHNVTLAVTYANIHGVHFLRSESVVQPTAIRFLMGSSGLYNENQLITNVTAKMNAKISLFSYFVLNRVKSNTEGLGTYRANPNSDVGEYSAASNDIRQRVSFGGTLTTKWSIRMSPLLTVASGSPFDITAGRDIYGTTLFNARPGFATNERKAGVVNTAYGLLDPNPALDQQLVPRNFGRGPGAIMLNWRISKTIPFGIVRERGAAPATRLPGDGQAQTGGVFSGAAASGASSASKRYGLTLQLSIRNILNHDNPGPINGNITSPLFGRANQAAGAGVPGGTGFSESANNRRLEFQTRLTF